MNTSRVSQKASRMPELFYRLPRNVIAIFSGWNLAWHLVAIGLTVAIVMSGLDWQYYLVTRYDWLFAVARPSLMLGTFLPVLVPLGLLIAGGLFDKRRAPAFAPELRRGRRSDAPYPSLVSTGWAVGQAALLGSAISSAYKAVTGRQHPPSFWNFTMPSGGSSALIDTSHGFRFGWLKGGVFWGWPSSHTTIAFAMASCLVAMHAKNRVLVWLAWAYAFYVGLSVSVTIHWLSEFVAGAIFGSIIGMVVGRAFRERMEDGKVLVES